MTSFRFALRMLFKTPFVTTVAVLSLALGVGANAAIFSLFDQVLVRPLPVPDSSRLVNLRSPGPKPGSQSCSDIGDCDSVFSYPMFRDLEKTQTVFTGLAAHWLFGANLSYRGQTSSGSGLEVSGSYFPVLELTPALGRLLGRSDDGPVGEPHVVVLGYDYWHSRFAANPNVLNDDMVVNGQHLTIVGVAPRGFGGTTIGDTPDVYVPITLRTLMEPQFDGFTNRRSYWAYLFARLKPGVSLASAQAAMNVPYHAIINDVEVPLQKGMSAATLGRFRTKALTMDPGQRGQSSLPEQGRVPLTLLQCVAAVVLVIACANIANLLLARSAARTSEMAVRLSIGATRGQLVRQLLLESGLLALLGGTAGLVVARVALGLIVRYLLPQDSSSVVTTAVEWPVVGFAAIVTAATAVLFGLFPALHTTRPSLAQTLRGVSGQAGAARSAAWFRTTLVTAQIALSTALLVGAGLFVKSLVRISRVDLGLTIDHVLAFNVSPQRNGYTPERSAAFFDRLEDALAAMPGVSSESVSIVTVLAGDNWGSSVAVEGFKAGPDVDTQASYNEVGSGFFRTFGIPLDVGREFTRADSLKAAKVAIVNEAFTRKFGLVGHAVGRLMSTGGKLDTTIVGVVRDAKYSDVKQTVPPQFFTPSRQDAQFGQGTVYVRTMLQPEAALALIPGVVHALDANLPVDELRTMPQQVRENIFVDRMIMTLATAFAALATLLAAVGLYGVLAYTVARRTREFGLRMALGAAPARVLRLVLGQVGRMTMVGTLLGAAAGAALGVVAESQLFDMKGDDPVVLTVSVVLLAGVAFASGAIPAIRASRVNPMRALRYE